MALVGNREIRKLNAQYRKKDDATDVLSFPAGETLSKRAALLGDVVISVEKAREQARSRGRPLKEELSTLLIHGVVHLLGYDHERSERDARIMERFESRLFRALCERGLLRVYSGKRPVPAGVTKVSQKPSGGRQTGRKQNQC